ncbi:MAG: fibronectin type III-like domain-contianing protein [Bacteroidales bacterium]
MTHLVKELKGYQKIFLKAGENKTITFTIAI